MAPRRRSLVWSFYRFVNDKKVQCQLCMESVVHTGHTTNMLRHLRSKHPVEVARAGESEKGLPATEETIMAINSVSGDYCSVEVAVDERCSDTEGCVTVNEADLTNTINGILKAAEGQVVAGQSEQGDTEGEVRSTRKWSSVWTHYERLEDQKHAKCLICTKKIQHHSSTSNLHRHLSKKHPEDFARLEGHKKKRSSDVALHTPVKEGLSKPPNKKVVLTDKYSEVFEVIGACEGEVRVLERERELTEALRSAQQQEARALEQQRELLETLRQAHAREAAVERESIECLRRTQEQESVALKREREELRREREELNILRRDVGQEQGSMILGQGVALSEKAHT